MSATRKPQPVATMRRIYLDNQVAAKLAEQSKLYGVPVQDLIGAACVILLLANGSVHSKWVGYGIELKNKRRGLKYKLPI